MSKHVPHASPPKVVRSKRCFLSTQLLLLFLPLLLAGPAAVAAQDPDEIYVGIYNLMDRADTLRQSGEYESARTKYEQARGQLLALKQSNPVWNRKLVTFRLDYLAEKIAALSQTNPPAAPGGASEAGAASGAQQVKVLDAGAEPRTVLRLKPKPGDKQVLSMTMSMAMSMNMGGTPAEPMKMPAIQTVLDSTVTDVTADGDIAYEMVVADLTLGDESGVAPQLAEAMKASAGSFKGFTTVGTMSHRGFNKTSDTKLPADADPVSRQFTDQMKDTLANISLPLPEEAVGLGARWQATLPLKAQGLTLNQTATYELTAIEGQHLTLTATVVQEAARQKVQNPAMPGMKMDVVKMTGDGRGVVTLDLGQLLPVKAAIKGGSELVMGMNLGGDKQTMTMTTETEIRLEAK